MIVVNIFVNVMYFDKGHTQYMSSFKALAYCIGHGQSDAVASYN